MPSDAKYIHLRNGVPIGYAMNNACSAGTGSFLEESAQSDLGIHVSDIEGIALTAPAPVKFKTTCAAFINSDIRIAQQQGQERDNILAGLVYAIADNYPTNVKGQPPVGQSHPRFQNAGARSLNSPRTAMVAAAVFCVFTLKFIVDKPLFRI